ARPEGRAAMTDLRLVVEPHAPESLKQHVRDSLDLHNVAATGQSEYYAVSVFLKDAGDEVLGGLLGSLWGGWLYVQHLWVAAPLRGQGHGRRLMQAAERYAAERGCRNAHLDTSSFQARASTRSSATRCSDRSRISPPGTRSTS